MRPALLTGMLLVLLGATPAAAISILVDDTLTPCRSISAGLPIVATVQEALALAAPGDHIGVCPGVYAGGITIATPGVTLEGFGATIVGGPTADFGILVRADDVTIAGLELSNFGSCAIRVGADRGSVVDNRLHGNVRGVCVYGDDAVVRYNTAQGNRFAILVSSSSRATIANNAVSDNRDMAITVDDSDDSAIHHNLVTGEFYAGITVNHSARATVSNNTVRDGVIGIQSGETDHLVIDHNAVTRTLRAINVYQATSCTVSSNAIMLTHTDPQHLIGNAIGLAASFVEHCLVTRNAVHRGRADGIRIYFPGPGNVISLNAASDNLPAFPGDSVFDCVLVLDGGTPPVFSQNACATEDPPGTWN